MNKTASLAIRIVAILAAAGAGYFWYSVKSQELDVAMEQTKWFMTDPEVRSGPAFAQRMEGAKKLQSLLAEKRKTIEEVTASKDAAEQMVAARDATINELNEDKNRLEGERIDAVRKREEMVSSTRQAESKVVQLQGELDNATAQIARLNGQIGEMKTQEECDALVEKANTAVDQKERAYGSYAQLRNWVVRQGLVPPYGPDAGDPTVGADSAAAQEISMMAEKIKTRVLKVDVRNGLVATSLSRYDDVEADKSYSVDVNGTPLGSVHIAKLGDDGMTVLSILPGANPMRYRQGMLISLTPIVDTPASKAAAKATAKPDTAPIAGK